MMSVSFTTAFPENIVPHVGELPAKSHQQRLTRLPKAVPLPDVGEYTDQIIFKELYLPSGLDLDKIFINLRAIKRVQRLAGLGTTTFTGDPLGEAGRIDLEPSGRNADGTGVFTGLGLRTPLSLTDTTVTYEDTGDDHTSYGKPQVNVVINKGEADERIEEAGDTADLYNSKAQAAILDKAIRGGLLEAGVYANVDSAKLTKLVGTCIGAVFALNTLFEDPSTRTVIGISLLGNEIESMLRRWRRSRDGNSFRGDIKSLRRSLVIGVAADRVIAASLCAVTATFAWADD